MSMRAHEELVRDGRVRAGVEPEVVRRNRFCNIVPVDAGLARCRDGYVNASVCSLQSGAEYVVAQGPIGCSCRVATEACACAGYEEEDTRGAFWSVAADNDVSVVVALAAFGPQVAPYVPPAGTQMRMGRWSVENRRETEILGGAGVRRDVRITSVAPDSDKSESHEITHLHFLEWPNYGVATVAHLTSLVKLADEEWARPQSRMMVHCSGGVGRSGAFVATHGAWRACSPLPPASRTREAQAHAIQQAVVRLREQRHPWMVETEEQMDLVHRAVERLLTITD